VVVTLAEVEVEAAEVELTEEREARAVVPSPT
jgi:hypothetical protein